MLKMFRGTCQIVINNLVLMTDLNPLRCIDRHKQMNETQPYLHPVHINSHLNSKRIVFLQNEHECRTKTWSWHFSRLQDALNKSISQSELKQAFFPLCFSMPLTTRWSLWGMTPTGPPSIRRYERHHPLHGSKTFERRLAPLCPHEWNSLCCQKVVRKTGGQSLYENMFALSALCVFTWVTNGCNE